MTDRPGFMLYFEVMPALDILDDAAAGRLFRALIAYGQYGEVRDLAGPEAVAFQMLRGRMDRDAAAYREKCQKSAYAAYVRDIRRQGGTPSEYEDWISGDIGRYPTINPIVTPNTNGISNANRKQADDGISTEFSTTEDRDTAWVLPFLEEQRKRVKKQA